MTWRKANWIRRALNLGETRALPGARRRHEFQRQTDLAKLKITSQSDLEKAESDAMSLKARLTRQDGG